MLPISETAVTTCIVVLKAYIDGTLLTNQCDALDKAIEDAYSSLVQNYLDNAIDTVAADHDWHDNPLDH